MTKALRTSALVAMALMFWMAGCGDSSSGPAATFGITGAVTGAVLEGVSVTASHDGSTVGTQTTASNGAFAFTGLGNGTYVLTPALAGYTFTPPTLTVNVSGADVAGLSFAATAVVAVPEAPTGVAATPGDGQVTVSWSAVAGASSYTVYSSATAGAGTSGTAVSGIADTSVAIGGLANATTYFFVVTASNSAGEGPPSSEVSAMPTAAVAFTQADLEGTWRFSVLSAGASPGWQRGTLSVDAGGNVTFSSYGDSSGATAAPAGFLPALFIDATGHVRDAAEAAGATFTGDLGAANRDLIAATASSGGTQSIAVLTKHGTASFSTSTDLLGFGNAGGGARRFVYDQITTGAVNQEWEFAGEQVGQGSSGSPGLPQYTSAAGSTLLPYLAPLTMPTRPTDRTLDMVVSADGVVTETRNATPGAPPNFIADHGFMTDDKTMIHAVGTATDGRFALRIYHAMNVVPGDSTTATQDDLTGTYAFRALSVGASALTARGTISVDASGAASYASYEDSAGSSSLPASFTLAVGSLDPLLSGTILTAPGYYGILGDPLDGSLHGKLAYRKDVVVFSRTGTAGNPGAYSVTIGVR